MAKIKKPKIKNKDTDFQEEDYDYSEDAPVKDNNVFAKSYKFLENKYFSFSDWLTKKGIPLNKLNNFLEEKGIPAFVFVLGIFLLLLVIIILIVLNIFTTATIKLNVSDYAGNQLSDVSLIIADSSNKTKFNGIVSNGQTIKAKLKSGGGYYINATKSGYPVFQNEIYFVRGESINIKFNEDVVTGELNLVVVDFDSKKKIPFYEAVISYSLNGETVEKVSNALDSGEVFFVGVPLNKKITLKIIADSYQNYSQTFTLTNSFETKTVELAFDESELSLSGKDGKLTIVATKENGDLLDAADITLYDYSGNLIGTDITVMGKAIFSVAIGQTIRFVITKDGYRTYDSDKDDRVYRIQNVEETFTAKLLASSSNLKVNIQNEVLNPITEVEVSLYNKYNNLLDTKTTLLDGSVTFTGLDNNEDYVITACKSGYYCYQQIANIVESNEIFINLERVSLEQAISLSIYVYDNKNSPVTNAKVNVYKEFMGTYLASGFGTLSLDLTGKTTITGKDGEEYLIVASIGEIENSVVVTLDSFSDNKVIILLDYKSKIVTLNLVDVDGNPITDGCLFITSKTGELLFDDCLYGSDVVSFYNQGYNDLIIDYEDPEGNLTTTSARLGNEDELEVKIGYSATGDFPIIMFTEIKDVSNSSTTLLSVNNDYYAVFDVLIPEGSTNCGVHIRAGDDSQTDSDNMTYGITGYKADSTNFKYSTTYNPGQQSIDYDNTGEPNQMNKWLELYWKNASGISSKQIMIKLKATEPDEKFVLKYRAWCEDTGTVYRDPEDPILGKARTNTQRQYLYAETKEKVFDILEKPVLCVDNLCIDYKFIDSDSFEYTPEKFYAVKDDVYALEFNLLSLKNTEIDITAETEIARPLIGFLDYYDVLNFPSYQVDSETIELSSSSIHLDAAKSKKLYLFFVTKGTGSTYLDLKINNNSKITEKRISFNVVPKKVLDVSIQEIIAYNSPITVTVKDKSTKQIVDNAFVKITDNLGFVLGSVKNSKSGNYIINQDFTVFNPMLEVTAPGYIPYYKEFTIADIGILQGPDRMEVRFGEEVSEEILEFSILNKSKEEIVDLRYEMYFLDYVASMQSSIDLPYSLKAGSTEKLELRTTIDPKANFKATKGVLTIFGFIGNKQIAKTIDIFFYKGTIKVDCLEIKPQHLFSYVGISEGSTQELEFTIINNCEKYVSLTPKLLNSKGTTIKKDENIEVIIPIIDLEPGEEVSDYIITIKNNKERKLTKTYDFEISWKNQYYVFDNTKLSVELVDLTKSITITPASSVVSLVQTVDQQSAINQTVFFIKNTGKYPVTDVQISRYEPKSFANIEDLIEPPSFDVLKPGESKPIVIRYKGQIDKATYADLHYQVTANAKGVSEPLNTKFAVAFSFSSSGCLKLDQTRISFYSRINDEKTKLINITNQCAEPVGLITHDQGNPTYFTDTFGDGTQVSIFPATPTPMILPGQTAGYYIKIKPTKYFPPKTEKVLRLLGMPLNAGQGGVFSSSSLLFSIEVEPEVPEQKEDYKRIEENVRINICGEEEGSEYSTFDLAYPVIVPDCSQDGYCDGASAAEYILNKLQDLHNDVINVANQANNSVYQTACSQTAANNGYCPIEDLLTPQKMEEYRNILIYLQNDSITEKTIDILLKEKQSNYPTLKNYLIRTNVGLTTGGLNVSGKIIHISNKFKGCGRYKIELNGYIATKNFTELDSEKAYFFVDVIDSNTTDQCIKTMENLMIYLPKDLLFKRNDTGETWPTIISGNKDFAEPIAKNIYGSTDRFVLRSIEQKKYNILDISLNTLEGFEESAIAKLSFKDSVESSAPKPEEITVIINDRFGYKVEGKNDLEYSEEFIKETSRSIQAILEGKPANVCISKDKKHLLIMSIDKDFGSLYLKSKTDKLQLKPITTCTEFTVKSPINEEIKITHGNLTGTQVYFNYNGEEQQDILYLVLEKDTEKDFNVCVKSDISQVGSWNNKEIKIIAESRFTESGKINAKRKAEGVLKISSYGLTPVDLLAVIESNAKEIGDKDSEIIYAYIDWDNSYNSQNTEEYCKAFEKYRNSLGESGTTLFRTPEKCELKETKKENTSKIGRAAGKAGIYLASCAGACMAAEGVVDFFWQFVPGVGQVKYLADVASTCGIGCGLPAITLFFKESEIGKPIFEAIDEITDSMPLVKEIKTVVGDLLKKAGAALGLGGEETGVSEGALLTTGVAVAGRSVYLNKPLPGYGSLSKLGVPEIGEIEIEELVKEATKTAATEGVSEIGALPDALPNVPGGSGDVHINIGNINVHGGPGGAATNLPQQIGGTVSPNVSVTGGSAVGGGVEQLGEAVAKGNSSNIISSGATQSLGTTAKQKVFSEATKKNMIAQMENRISYAEKGFQKLGVTEPFLAEGAKNTSSIAMNLERLTATELKTLENLNRQMLSNGQFNFDKFVKLSDTQLKEYVRLVDKAGYTGKSVHMVKDAELFRRIGEVQAHRANGGVFNASKVPGTPNVGTSGATNIDSVQKVTSSSSNVGSGGSATGGSGSASSSANMPQSMGDITSQGGPGGNAGKVEINIDVKQGGGTGSPSVPTSGAGAGITTPGGPGVGEIENIVTTKMKSISPTVLASQEKLVTKNLTDITKGLSYHNTQIDAISKNKGIFALSKKSKIASHQASIAKLEKAQEALLQRDYVLKSVKANPDAFVDGVYVLDDTATSVLSQNVDDVMKGVPKAPTKFSNFLRTGAKMGLDMVVVYAANYTANKTLSWVANKGKLKDLIYINDEVNISEFKKQVWYRVQIYKTENESLTILYIQEEPNITNENIIYYKSNKDVIKLITTEEVDQMYQTNDPQTSALYTPNMNPDLSTDLNDVENILELQTKLYIIKESKLNEYAGCSFSKEKSVCNDLSAMGPNYCALFAKEVAKKVYDIDYTPSNACDNASSNFGTKNKVVWQNGVDPDREIENHLVPGVILTIRNTGGTTLNCEPSHVVLYVGKKNGSSHYIIQQLGNKSVMGPLFKSEGGSFTLSQVYQVVIPASGYPLYSQYSNSLEISNPEEPKTPVDNEINPSDSQETGVGFISPEFGITASQKLGISVVELAKNYIGNKYVYGGTNPDKGIDCSAFVQYLYKKHGVSLPRVATDQSRCGATVSGLENAKPGDLIFYKDNKNPKKMSHVTIYMGDGKMIHASNSAPYPKGGIKVSDVYSQNKIGAIKRVTEITKC